ncbi:MAG: hypothetical protein CME64_11670 [Halobacteriovoraceae bacterium]|nr:hypothetical protein [Halobacteriovoraceae bacterium]|tara:strand:- start:84069 stop:84692 length:624 start_codon:yes stop_codon:yes gene_type:complete
MKAIILGSTGLVGGHLLRLLLESESFREVVAFNRRSLGIEHAKLKEEIVDFDQIQNLDVSADFMFCCLGTTIKKAGSKEAFRKVDLEIPLSFARNFSKTKHQGFVVISAIGANKSSPFFYNKVKGELEYELKNASLKKLAIVRPSLLLGDRTETRLGEDIGQFLSPLLKFVLPARYSPIKARHVACAMVDLALRGKTDQPLEYEVTP